MADPNEWGPLIVKKGDEWYKCENNADLPGNLFSIFEGLVNTWGAATDVVGGYNDYLPGYPLNITYLQSGAYKVILSYESELLEPSEVPLYAG